MKRALIAVLAAALSGCASLNVSWSLTASYNTQTLSTSQAVHEGQR